MFLLAALVINFINAFVLFPLKFPVKIKIILAGYFAESSIKGRKTHLDSFTNQTIAGISFSFLLQVFFLIRPALPIIKGIAADFDLDHIDENCDHY